MNRKSNVIFSFIAVIIFLCTIVFFTVKIGFTASEGKQNAREQFSLLVQKTYDLLEIHNGISDAFVNSYISIINQHDNIGAVVINDAEYVYFVHPLNSKLITLEGSQHYSIQTNSSIVSVFSATLPLNAEVSVTLTAAMYHITPSQMYNYARIAFMIILITTLAVFLLLVLQYIKDKQVQSETINNSSIFNYDKTYEIPLDTGIIDSIPDPVVEIETAEQDDSPQEALQNDDNITSQSLLGQRISDPLGLFSKETGFGWESYLETRLDSELARAASSEQDLALIVVKIKNLERTPPHIKAVSLVFLDLFKFRDLIFEYGSDGFACIVQEMDLDMAMKLAEKLYSSLQTTLKEYDVSNVIGIGISTRTLRIIPGSRILQESSQACDKAFEEDGLPIVAFRVNPDKYRKFLSEIDD